MDGRARLMGIPEIGDAGDDLTRARKKQTTNTGPVFFRTEPNHLRDLRHLRIDLADLARLFARGYLRLTQQRGTAPFLGDGEPQKPLDVSRPESPDCERERAPWKQH